MLNSLYLWKKDLSSCATGSGQPYRTNWSTLESAGSPVQNLTCCADTGAISKCSITRIVLSGIGISWILTGSDNLLHQSPLICCEACLY